MSQEEEDGELMQRYARGDLRAFERLYARHRTALYRYLARQVRDHEIANDLFQEVWSRVIATRTRYEPRAKFRTYLFRIAHNCFIDHCRRTAARPGEAGGDEEGASQLAAPERESPLAQAEHAETLARYREALRVLPPAQRDVFLLYEESGLTLEEIATITGVGMETAKSRLRYALAKLRAALAPAEERDAPGAAPLGEPGL